MHKKFHTRVVTLAAAAVITAAVGLTLAGCSGHGESAAPKPAPEALSASEAGGIYLDAVCPVNAAWDEADLELERLRLTLSRGEDDTRRFSAAMTEVAAASKTAVLALDPQTLDEAGHAWPATASSDITAVQKTLQNDQKQAARVAKLTGNEVLNYSWQGAEEVGAAASAAREALGLPADGQNACDQWQEQAEAEKAQADEAAADTSKAEKSADEKSDGKTGTPQ